MYARRMLILTAAMLLLAGCGQEGDKLLSAASGATTTPTVPTGTVIQQSQDLPGVVVAITSLTGGSGTGGNLQPGDTMAVTFTIKKTDGTSLPLSEMDSTAIWVAGPTTNYQRVLPQGKTTFYLTDVKTAAVQNADGSYTYTFATAFPATYGPPLYDTTKFTTGELTGQALLSGTYTLALRLYKNYYVDGTLRRDPGLATKDFLVGSATTISARQVVKDENCNQCHVKIQMHGGTYQSTRLCVTCHTAGSEDRNSTDAADPTNVTIDFKVMIHKLHNGTHLPSVLGITTDANGARVYGAGTEYRVGGSSLTTSHNFGEIGFPVWPSMTVGMPRDDGYTALAAASKTAEDTVRGGVVACAKCHDGATGGAQAYSSPSRAACGSCHDDVNWAATYTTNGLTMPAQADDASCIGCHPSPGGAASTVGLKDNQATHLHPLKDPAINTGMVLAITAVDDAGAADNNDGTIDVGEKVSITFTLKDGTGANLDPATAAVNSTITLIMSGPNHNRNILNYTSFAKTALGAAANNYTLLVPEDFELQYVGNATGVATAFAAGRTPFWDSKGSATVVKEVTAVAGAGKGDTTVAVAAVAGNNFLTVVSTANFAVDDFVVINDVGAVGVREYRKIGQVDAANNRLYFTDVTNHYGMQAGLKVAHAIGVTVREVTLTTRTVTTEYTVTEATGQVTEVAGKFTAGNAIVIDYKTDYVLPAVYPRSINQSTDLTKTVGRWNGLAMESGSYAVGIYGRLDLTVTAAGALTAGGEKTTYNGTSAPAIKDFLVGSPTETTPVAYDKISSSSNCYACHDDMYFHGGGRRGFDTCMLCHATSGMEDKPHWRYTAALQGTIAQTTGVQGTFRQVLHKIHAGNWLTAGVNYKFNGNSSTHTYEKVGFPAMPGGAAHCATCHGSTNTKWKEPADRDHSTDILAPVVIEYANACASCHDSSSVQGHIALNTGNGIESCGVCHGLNRENSVEVMHKQH